MVTAVLIFNTRKNFRIFLSTLYLLLLHLVVNVVNVENVMNVMNVVKVRYVVHVVNVTSYHKFIHNFPQLSINIPNTIQGYALPCRLQNKIN